MIPDTASGLKLYKIVRGDLVACEAIRFERGKSAVQTVLNRAAVSGRVEINGDIEDYFADVLDADGSMVETVALDRKSYAALKNKWMRCKIERQSHKNKSEA